MKTIVLAEGDLKPYKFTGIVKKPGYEAYYKEGKFHRLDGPAVEEDKGGKNWYKEGFLHRLDGPAVEKANGDKEWWVEGKLHRADGPARNWRVLKEWSLFYKNINSEKTILLVL